MCLFLGATEHDDYVGRDGVLLEEGEGVGAEGPSAEQYAVSLGWYPFDLATADLHSASTSASSVYFDRCW